MNKYRAAFGPLQDHNHGLAPVRLSMDRTAKSERKFKYRVRQILCIRLNTDLGTVSLGSGLRATTG